MSDGSVQNSSLPQFLAQRARNASDFRLVLDAAAGLLVATGAAVARPWGYIMLASAGACFAAFGFWGIVDRELSEREPTLGPFGSAMLLSARALAGVLGVAGGLTLIYGALAVMLGTWIS